MQFKKTLHSQIYTPTWRTWAPRMGLKISFCFVLFSYYDLTLNGYWEREKGWFKSITGFKYFWSLPFLKFSIRIWFDTAHTSTSHFCLPQPAFYLHLIQKMLEQIWHLFVQWIQWPYLCPHKQCEGLFQLLRLLVANCCAIITNQ